MRFPKSRLLIFSSDQAHNIEGIKKGDDEGSFVIITGSLDLRHAISRKINFVRPRQLTQRVKDVEQCAISEHQARFENPEKPLVAKYRAPSIWGKLVIDSRRGGIVLDGTVNGPDRNDCAATIQYYEHIAEFAITDAGAAAVEVKFCGYADEEDHACNLQQKSGFEQGLADVLLGCAEGIVCDFGGAVACQSSNDGIETEEGGHDSTGMKGGMIGNVVEDTAEDEVIRAFVDRTRRTKVRRLRDLR